MEGRSAKYSSPAATCLAFEEGQVNQFYVGTEEGAVYHGARHGRFVFSLSLPLLLFCFWSVNGPDLVMGW